MRVLGAVLVVFWSFCGMASAASVERVYSISIEAEVSDISFFFYGGQYADGDYFDDLTYTPTGPFQSHIGAGSWLVDVDEQYAVGTRATIQVDVDRHTYEYTDASGNAVSEVVGYSSTCTVVVHCQSYGGNEPPAMFRPAFSVNNGTNQVTFDLDNNLLIDMPDTSGIGWFSDALIPNGDPEWMTITWFVSSYQVTHYANQTQIASAPLPAPAWMLLASVGLLGAWRRRAARAA